MGSLLPHGLIDFKGGLHAQGGALQGFAISADGENFLWAQAEIQGMEVVVWNDAITNPVSVRYAWGSNPKWANLFNDQDLGAAPFSTEADVGAY